MWLIGKTVGLKDTMVLGKNMNGANLPVFLLEVNGANIVFYPFLNSKSNTVKNI